MATWLVSRVLDPPGKGDSRVQEDVGLCQPVIINSCNIISRERESELNPDERSVEFQMEGGAGGGMSRAGNIVKIKINIKTPTSHKQGVKCRKYYRVLTVNRVNRKEKKRRKQNEEETN